MDRRLKRRIPRGVSTPSRPVEAGASWYRMEKASGVFSSRRPAQSRGQRLEYSGVSRIAGEHCQLCSIWFAKSRVQGTYKRLWKGLRMVKSRTRTLAVGRVFTYRCTCDLAYWLLFAAIFGIYWRLNRRYPWPTNSWDEIGYLSKAIAFAGFPVDKATDWHGGYSLMVAPVFWLFSDPFVVWQGVLVLNAAMWVASLALLFHLLRHLFPDRGFWAIWGAVALSAAYPAWITMSGYAFATSGFVLVFMLALLALTKAHAPGRVSLSGVAFSALVGFLYWVHPTGLAVAAASLLVMGMWAFLDRVPGSLVVHSVVVGVMITAYQLGVHPWLNNVMTPPGYELSGHYPEASSVLRGFFHAKVLLAVVVATLGQLSQLLVASLGIVSIGVRETLDRLAKVIRGTTKTPEEGHLSLVMSFSVLSVLGIVCLGAITFSSRVTFDGLHVDHWIYGRYAEMALLPVLGMGLLAVWRRSWFVISAGLVLVTAFLFLAYVDETNTKNYINEAFIPAFWPLPVLPNARHHWWLIAGAAGVLAGGILGRRFMPLLALPLFTIALVNQASWHSMLSAWSKPASLVGFVRENFNSTSCIGIDPVQSKDTLTNTWQWWGLYSFYFYDYDFRRMTSSEWLENCDGPYLTVYGESIGGEAGVSAVGRVESNDLFLMVKDEVLQELTMPPGIIDAGDVKWDLEGLYRCLLKGCYQRNAKALTRFSEVGAFVDGRLRSDGEEGFLFYGPYVPLAEGEYVIEVDGRFPRFGGAVLDVVSERGGEVHVQLPLDEYGREIGQELVVPFVLSSPVKDIEIRLRVTSSNRIAIEGYTIKMQDD